MAREIIVHCPLEFCRIQLPQISADPASHAEGLPDLAAISTLLSNYDRSMEVLTQNVNRSALNEHKIANAPIERVDCSFGSCGGLIAIRSSRGIWIFTATAPVTKRIQTALGKDEGPR
jgi:hypothetical protein